MCGEIPRMGEVSRFMLFPLPPPPSEAAPYLPQEEKSPLFSVQREGLPEDGTLYRINR